LVCLYFNNLILKRVVHVGNSMFDQLTPPQFTITPMHRITTAVIYCYMLNLLQ